MDGSFGPQSGYPGERGAFHRHSQSSSTHPALDFSSLMQPPLPTGQSVADASRLPNGGAYESHDDLCVDQCTGIGLYNGAQFFNHRTPAAMPAGWPGRATAMLSYPADMSDSAMSVRPGFAPAHPGPYHHHQQQEWWAHGTSSSFDQSCLGAEEDCTSMDSCCDSQCTMTGKCSNVACANTEDTCTDQTCPDALPSEIVDGAAALLSINHNPEQQADHGFAVQPSLLNEFDCDLSSFLAQHSLFSPTVSNVANHLLQAHGDEDSSTCMRPCLLDDPRNYTHCGMPIPHSIASFDNQYRAASTTFQLSQDFGLCRAEVGNPEDYIVHFNQQHRRFLAANTGAFPSWRRIHGGGVMQSIEAMSSSPTTPLDTTDSGASSHTPSPLTPMSASLDMSEMKQPDATADRSMSIASAEDPQSHQCLWRDEGSEGVCGQRFQTPEELFAHAANTHIKNARKGEFGFRCGWHDCPRSDPDAAGFPQRSKIERHMQTHIDHKPHICQICNKGFSAKQALNQHLFIHSNLKPLVCEICGKAFRYPSALTMHQRVHSGEKPLHCNICGKSFSESSNLSKHKRTHEVRGRFSCQVPGCDRNFHRQDQLRRHMKTHQKEGCGGQVEMLASRLESVFED